MATKTFQALALCLVALCSPREIAAQEAPLVGVPQVVHRFEITEATFDDGDRRAAVVDSGGMCSILDVPTGRVLASRSIHRQGETVLQELSLRGAIFQAVVQDQDGSRLVARWDWVEDEFALKRLDGDAMDIQFVGVSPTGRAAVLRQGEDGSLVIDLEGGVTSERRVRISLRSASRVTWPHDDVLVVETGVAIELRDANRPRRVLHRLPGTAVATGWGAVAVADGEKVRVVELPGGEVREFDHSLGTALSRVVIGEDALGVVGGGGSEIIPLGPQGARSTFEGSVRWVGPLTALVQRGTELFRVRRRGGAARRVVSIGRGPFGNTTDVYPGEHGAFFFFEGEAPVISRTDGSRLRLESGATHSVWHARFMDEERLLVAGRFGVQTWTESGVVDAPACDGEGLFGLRGDEILSAGGRCQDGRNRAWGPEPLQAAAASPDLGTVLLSDGRLRDLGSGRDVRLAGLDARTCWEEETQCSWAARLVGPLVVVVPGFTDDGPEVFAGGRRLLPPTPGQRVAVAGDGSRFAAYHHRGGIVRDAQGRELFAFGERSGAAASRPVAFNPDGSRMAWMPDATTVELVDAQGQVIRRHTVPEGATEMDFLGEGILVYSRSQTTVLSEEREARAFPPGVSQTHAACSQGRFVSLDRNLRPVRGPACTGGLAAVRRGRYVQKRGGVVRVYRAGQHVTVGSLRETNRVTHFAFDERGRWWSSSPERHPIAWRRGPDLVENTNESDIDVLRWLAHGS